MSQVVSTAAARTVLDSGQGARALVVPQTGMRASRLRERVADELRITTQTVAVSTLTIDGQPYLIATWPSANDARGSSLATLADQLDGELLD
jgi:hypothetical protein